MSEKNLEAMSDEEILDMEPPAIEDEEPKEEAPKEVPESEQQEESEKASSQESSEEEEEEEEESEEEEAPQQVEQPEIDYKSFYEQVMSPFKANGGTVQLRSPQEVVKLMQMGANYTQKMQILAPYRKKVQMLQKANLLDDDKLNYLIDLSQGNPEAIKKLIKDSKLDPMDLDIYGEQNYVPGNHTVSDAEMQLQTTLDELTSTPEGLQTVNLARGWDQASLSEIGKDPSILATLHEQRMNGVYDFITKEMQHQKMLGNLPDNIPFLQAYKAVGDFCLQQLQQRQQQQQAVANLPKGTLNQGMNTNNSAQVKSAAPSGRSRKAASTFVDPFSLSDEEFEKQFANYA